MQITTPRLVLRPIALTDAAATHAYASDREHTKYMVFLPKDSLAETEAFIRAAVAEWAKPNPSYLEFAILAGGTQVGGMSLFFLDKPGEAELGWILDPRHTGRGYAEEAARALMDHAAKAWGVRRFIAQCDAENAASWRLMERLGMKRVSCTGGRKNRSSDEERQELTYEIVIQA